MPISEAPRICPGCAGETLVDEYHLERQPVVQNYRFATPAAALTVPRADVRLTQCALCGLVFNRVFEAELMPYDEAYDNQQGCSPAFQDHWRERAGVLARRYRLAGGAILELGCGKGDFLRLLCHRAEASGVGYDTTYTGPDSNTEGTVRFHRRYVSASDVTRRFDAVLCRHVIEHVPQPGLFLEELRAIATAAGDPVVVLETPRWEWIVEGGYFWDVFYEHCNYFSEPTLAYLCRRAGFEIRNQEPVFAGQYQWLELRLAPPAPNTPPGVLPATRLGTFRKLAERTRLDLAVRLKAAGAEGGWAIWGAGAKGVTLANQMPELLPQLVIDANPDKQGGVVPGTSIPIVGPEDPALQRARVILIVNPAYEREITSVLRRQGSPHRILVL
jgi:SAM-dependent methyltransferase